MPCHRWGASMQRGEVTTVPYPILLDWQIRDQRSDFGLHCFKYQYCAKIHNKFLFHSCCPPTSILMMVLMRLLRPNRQWDNRDLSKICSYFSYKSPSRQGLKWLCSLGSPSFTILRMSFHAHGGNWASSPKLGFQLWEGRMRRQGSIKLLLRVGLELLTSLPPTSIWLKLKRLPHGAARKAGKGRLYLGGLVLSSKRILSLVERRKRE